MLEQLGDNVNARPTFAELFRRANNKLAFVQSIKLHAYLGTEAGILLEQGWVIIINVPILPAIKAASERLKLLSFVHLSSIINTRHKGRKQMETH